MHVYAHGSPIYNYAHLDIILLFFAQSSAYYSSRHAHNVMQPLKNIILDHCAQSGMYMQLLDIRFVRLCGQD